MKKSDNVSIKRPDNVPVHYPGFFMFTPERKETLILFSFLDSAKPKRYQTIFFLFHGIIFNGNCIYPIPPPRRRFDTRSVF